MNLDDLFEPPPCGRCMGTGRVRYRYGVPGQDPHTPASKVIWQNEGRERTCPVCHGTGVGKITYPQRKWIVFDEYGNIVEERPIKGKEVDDNIEADAGGVRPDQAGWTARTGG